MNNKNENSLTNVSLNLNEDIIMYKWIMQWENYSIGKLKRIHDL